MAHISQGRPAQFPIHGMQPSFASSAGSLDQPEAPKKLAPIKLENNREERVIHQRAADFFSIIVALEQLESAYIRGIVGGPGYDACCRDLLAQFKTLSDAAGHGDDRMRYLEQFMKDNGLTSCGAAVNRIRLGVPARVSKNRDAGHSEDEEATMERAFCVQATELFITVMNALQLEYRAIDQLQPDLAVLVDTLNKVRRLPDDHESRTKMTEWLLQLNNRRASDELSADDARQMQFDVEKSYNTFKKWTNSN